MLLSILIPVFNDAPYLNACLRSVTAQDWSDCEILLCDDGSSDGSLSACRSFEALYPGRVRVFHHPENRGPLLTRRHLFAEARGEYLFCVDADDELMPGALETLKEAVGKTGADMILFDAVCVRPDGSEERIGPGLEDGRLYAGEEKAAVLEQACTGRDIGCLPLKIFRRSIADLEENYSPWQPLMIGEDRFQSYPLFDRAASVYCLHTPLYRYIKRGDGLTGHFREDFYDLRKILWEREDRYFVSWNIRPECMEEIFRRRCSEIINHLGRKRFTGSPKLFLEEAGRIRQDGLFGEYCSKTTLPPRYRRYGQLLLGGRLTLLYLALNAERQAAGPVRKVRALLGKGG